MYTMCVCVGWKSLNQASKWAEGHSGGHVQRVVNTFTLYSRGIYAQVLDEGVRLTGGSQLLKEGWV